MRSEQGDLWRLALPTKEEVIIMSMEYIVLLMLIAKQGKVISVTVNKTSVTIRVKK